MYSLYLEAVNAIGCFIHKTRELSTYRKITARTQVELQIHTVYYGYVGFLWQHIPTQILDLLEIVIIERCSNLECEVEVIVEKRCTIHRVTAERVVLPVHSEKHSFEVRKHLCSVRIANDGLPKFGCFVDYKPLDARAYVLLGEATQFDPRRQRGHCLAESAGLNIIIRFLEKAHTTKIQWQWIC